MIVLKVLGGIVGWLLLAWGGIGLLIGLSQERVPGGASPAQRGVPYFYFFVIAGVGFALAWWVGAIPGLD